MVGRSQLHGYLTAGTRLPWLVVRDVARFRTSSHDLRVATGRFTGLPFKLRDCIHCRKGRVDTEHHLLFDCVSTASVRECAHFACLAELGNLTDLFLHSNERLVAHFVSKCMRARQDFPGED